MLSDKKKAFARGIVQGLSNKDAAIQAGYEKKSASQAGSRLAGEKAIIAYIDRLRNVKEKLEGEGKNVDVADLVPVGTTEQVRNHKSNKDPLDFLLGVMSDVVEDIDTRVAAAKAALPYVHAKKGDVGVAF